MSLLVDGEPMGLSQQREAGAFVETLQLDVGPGQSKVLQIEFAGVTADGAAVDEVRGWPQPLVLRERWGSADTATSCDNTIVVDGRSHVLSP